MASWLTAQPYAHRGLHDAALGVIENTPSAFHAAIDAGYGIECDVQLSADGEAMVHHDFILGRLTRGNSRLDERTTAYLKGIEYFATADRMPTLGELCDMVGDRVPLLVEIKSRFNGDTRLARRTGEVLAACRGPVAAMSFDPAVVGDAPRDFTKAPARDGWHAARQQLARHLGVAKELPPQSGGSLSPVSGL